LREVQLARGRRQGTLAFDLAHDFKMVSFKHRTHEGSSWIAEFISFLFMFGAA
jgi:hypothetical protein